METLTEQIKKEALLLREHTIAASEAINVYCETAS